jgi:hypothetical protein
MIIIGKKGIHIPMENYRVVSKIEFMLEGFPALLELGRQLYQRFTVGTDGYGNGKAEAVADNLLQIGALFINQFRKVIYRADRVNQESNTHIVQRNTNDTEFF